MSQFYYLYDIYTDDSPVKNRNSGILAYLLLSCKSMPHVCCRCFYEIAWDSFTRCSHRGSVGWMVDRWTSHSPNAVGFFLLK